MMPRKFSKAWWLLLFVSANALASIYALGNEAPTRDSRWLSQQLGFSAFVIWVIVSRQR